MRRSDEEFKAELLLRVEKYKEHRQKQCRNALKGVSLAVMVCVLVASSQWGNFATPNWFIPSDEIGTEQTMTEMENGEEKETSSQTSEDSAIRESEKSTEDTIITEDECEGIESEDEIAGSPEEYNGLSGISIQKENEGLQTEEAENLSQETKYYPDRELAEQMTMFLAGKTEEAEENTETLFDAVITPSGMLSGEMYRIVVHYADGQTITYRVTEGIWETYMKDGCLVLDKESWKQLFEMTENREWEGED